MSCLRCVCLLSALLFPVVLFGQRTKKVEVDYMFHVPEHCTIELAKQIAVDRAKIQAIADEFGTLVTQSNTNIVSNQDGKSTSEFLSLGSSDVKGEWIETIGTPIFDISYEEGQLVVKVHLKGRIREAQTTFIELKTEVLCNGTTEKFASTHFRDGDDMFLLFCSPIDGYLIVYLADVLNHTVYCLLPYGNSGDSSLRIEHDQTYLLFSQAHVPQDQRNMVDEYTLTCASGQERNDLFVIFSPNEFVKANSEASDGLLPRKLAWKDFNAWLAKCRKRDDKMQVRQMQLFISAKE